MDEFDKILNKNVIRNGGEAFRVTNSFCGQEIVARYEFLGEKAGPCIILDDGENHIVFQAHNIAPLLNGLTGFVCGILTAAIGAYSGEDKGDIIPKGITAVAMIRTKMGEDIGALDALSKHVFPQESNVYQKEG